MIQKILIRGTNWIGDAIITFPAISCLRRMYPHAQLDLVARPWVEPVYRCHPDINKIILYPAESGTIKRLISMGRAADHIRTRGYDTGVLLSNSFESALFFKMAGIPFSLGYATDLRKILLTRAVPVPEGKERRHHVFYYLDLVRSLDREKAGMDSSILKLELNIPEEESQKAHAFLRDIRRKDGHEGKGPVVGLNPGAAFGQAKCWPSDRFRELAKLLCIGFPALNILILGTSREKAMAEVIRKADPERIINLCGKTTLLEAASLINELDLLITNDSGLMHVGASCSTPLVAIFGSTNPVATGPWSENARIISHNPGCAPCMERTCSRNFDCMLGIHAEEVFEASKDILRSLSGQKQ